MRVFLILITHPDDLIKRLIAFIVTARHQQIYINALTLTPLIKASKTIGKALKRLDIAVYESTVYPGATEEVCVPIHLRTSLLKFNKDFFYGYSPERINSGDKEHSLTTIKKVTLDSQFCSC